MRMGLNTVQDDSCANSSEVTAVVLIEGLVVHVPRWNDAGTVF